MLFLLITLLFGAPVLAALVVGFSASVLAVGYGLTALVATKIDVDPVAVAGGALVGLTLGSAFALIVVARYREEIWRRGVERRSAPREDRVPAVTATVNAAGRTVLLAGTASVLMMVAATELGTTAIINSVGIGAAIISATAALAAVGVLPAVLVAAGQHLDAFSFLGLGDRARRVLPKRVPLGIIRHPIVIGGIARRPCSCSRSQSFISDRVRPTPGTSPPTTAPGGAMRRWRSRWARAGSHRSR